MIGGVAAQAFPLGEHRRPAGAKLFRHHLAGVKIVAHMFADPDLVILLDPDFAVGNCLPGLLVHRGGVRRQHGAPVFHHDPVRGRGQAGAETVNDSPFGGERLDFPFGFLLRVERDDRGQEQERQRSDRAQSCHWARQANQMASELPRPISSARCCGRLHSRRRRNRPSRRCNETGRGVSQEPPDDQREKLGLVAVHGGT